MKKFIEKSIIITISIFLISFILIEILILIEGKRTTSNKVDYIIILGARLYGDIPSPSLLERIKVAKKYLLDNEDVKVICSGGQGINEYISEAEAMKLYLIENGIEESRIFIEDKSTNTFENLKMSLDEIKKYDNRDNLKFLIATNKYHVFRSKMLAKRLGVDVYGLPAKIPPTIVYKSYIREYFAVIKSFFFDRV